MKILVGTPIYCNGAYALEKFLANQQQIQLNRPDCDLVFSTDEYGYVDELNNFLHKWTLRGTVITHKFEKPGYAKSRLWNIASARESIRQYFLSQTEANRLLFLDADMTYDPVVVSIMEKEMTNHDAVFSGYRFKNNRIGLIGAGCLLLERDAVEKIKFRCYEFKNGQVINEDNLVEMDLFRHGCRIKKGFFLAIDHYASETEVRHISPRKVGLFRKIINSAFVRFCLIGTSVAIHYNIPAKGLQIIWGISSFYEKQP
jgi:hypothetical protein